MKYLLLTGVLLGFCVSCTPRDEAVLERTKERLLDEERGLQPKAGDVLDQPGQKLTSCKGNDWSDMRTPEELDTLIFSGEMELSIQTGNFNCYRVGAVLNLRAQPDLPVRGRVKIDRIEILRLDDLLEEHAELAAEPLEELKERLSKRMKPRDQGLVNLAYFTLIEGGAE